MTHTELDRLVAQIGEELLARVGPSGRDAQKGRGLNLPDQVCPGCVQRCVQTCARNTKEIIAAGASRVSASEKLTQDRPRHRGADRPHHPEARSHARRRRQDLPRGAPVPLRQRVRESLLGAAGEGGTGGLAGEGLHRGGLPAGRHQHRGQGRRDRGGAARRRAGDRHGDQRRARCGPAIPMP